MPLAACLLAIVAAVSLPLVLLVGTTVWCLYRSSQERYQEQLVTEARQISRQVDQEFIVLETVARSLANSAALARGDMTGFAEEMRAARAALAAESPGADAAVRVDLLNREGAPRLLHSGQAEPSGQAFAMRAMAAGKPRVSDLLQIARPGTFCLGAAVPVFAPGQPKVVGAVVIYARQRRLLDLAQSIALAPGVAASIQDRNGITAARSRNAPIALGQKPAPPVLQAIQRKPFGLLARVRAAGGMTDMVAFARAPSSGFTVLLSVPRHRFLAPVRHVFIRTASLAIAVVFLCALLALWFGGRIARAFRRVPAAAAEQLDGVAPRPTGLREADALAGVLAQTLAERIRAEALCHESEERLRLAVEAAEIGLWDVDPIADRLYWPPTVKAMFGMSADAEVAMADFFACLHPEDRDRVAAAYNAALDPAQRAPYDVVFRTVGKEDGTIRWVAAKGRAIFDETGRCTRVIGTCIDTTVRRATARQLRELNETLEQRVAQATQERDRVWRNSRDILAVVDARGVLRAVNPAATAVLGYEPGEVVGHNFLQFVWAADVPMARRGFENASSGSNLTSFQVRFCHKDGTARWLSWHTTREGPLTYAYGRDITAEKAAAAELAAAQETLHQTQKIETIGQLTGGVAHDFNNLLTPIVGALDMLVLRSEGDDRARRIATAALQAADRARTLIQRLLAFSRRQHLEARAVDVRALIENLQELAARSLGPQIRLELEIADNLPPAWVDPNQLELALLNLAVNARDAMSGAGTLTIAVSEEVGTLPGKLLPGRYIRIAVTDNGCGMDADTLKRAVEPFFTTKTVGRGTGLGLSMVHGLAAQSGGDFTLHSVVGRGTTATLRLPVSRKVTARQGGETPHPDLPAVTHQATVLLVDDEELVRTGIAEMLRDAGFTVTQAESGLAALSMVQNGLRPDVVVTDYAMPGMTGVELARILQDLLPELPVLLVTGYARLENDDADNLARLAKPFRQRDIIAALAGLLRETRALEQTE